MVHGAGPGLAPGSHHFSGPCCNGEDCKCQAGLGVGDGAVLRIGGSDGNDRLHRRGHSRQLGPRTGFLHLELRF